MSGKMHLGAPVVPHPDQVREVVEDKKRIVEAPPVEPDVMHAHGHSADVQIHEAKQQKMPSNVKGAPAKKVVVPYRESKAHKDEPLIDDEKLSLDMIHGKPIPLEKRVEEEKQVQKRMEHWKEEQSAHHLDHFVHELTHHVDEHDLKVHGHAEVVSEPAIHAIHHEERDHKRQ